MNDSASERRSRIPWVALIVGSVCGAAALAVIQYGPFEDSLARRYVSHPVESVEVIMFGCALAAFISKWRRARWERCALRANLLPPTNGQPAPVSEASVLAVELQKLPVRIRDTWVVGRLHSVLHYIGQRGSTSGLEEHLRTLSDNDANALESSYSLTRFITWAIPILGFLGTVLGITEAIAGVTPEVLEQSLSSVTDGLALAFDSTALALALTMAAMFVNLLVERAEWGALEAVDLYVERYIAHRFESENAAEPTAGLQAALERIVRRQAELWAETMAAVDRRRVEMETKAEAKLTVALQAALDRTLEAHASRLKAMEKASVDAGSKAVERIAEHARSVCESGKEQQLAIAKLVQGVTAQVQSLSKLQAGEEQLLRMQESLDRNLSALAAASSLDQAVHSLTAAIHLLTSRADPAHVRKAA